MFPMVPSHNLAELHEEIENDCPEPYPSMGAACKETIPAVLRQLKDQTYLCTARTFLRRRAVQNRTYQLKPEPRMPPADCTHHRHT